MSARDEEIAANVARANESVQAAKLLAAAGYSDFAASRAYYAAFYAASALLLSEGIEFGKHSAVIATIHQRYVKTGRIEPAMGKMLNWLFELRAIGDYGETRHVPSKEAGEAIEAAESFVTAVGLLLDQHRAHGGNRPTPP